MNKKFIRILTVCLLVVALLAFTACEKTEGSQNASDTEADAVVEALYQSAVENGTFQGSLDEFIEYLKGDSAYDIAVENGFVGNEKEWLASLQGTNGMDGESNTITLYDIYEEAKEKSGYTGTFLEFISDYVGQSTQEDRVNQSNLLSSVSIYCHFTEVVSSMGGGFWFGGNTQTNQPVISTGSGVFYKLNKETGSGYIITNYHVVYDASSTTGISDDILVYLYGGEIIGNEVYTEEYCNYMNQYGYSIPTYDYEGNYMQARYIGGSMNYDIAVLYVENSEVLKNSEARAITFADSNNILAGQTAFAIGNPEGDGISVTKGVVSVDSENLTMTAADNRTTTTFRVIRIDTAVNSGNSGGGLFDASGNLIGIVNAKTSSSDVENIGYALPSNVVKYIVENILDYQNTSEKTADVRKCMLGITISAKSSSAVLDEGGVVRIHETVVINSVQEEEKNKSGEVTAEAGLAYGKLQEGDILLKVKIHRTGSEEGVYEEYNVNRTFIIVDLMLTMRVGDTLILDYEREGTQGSAEFIMTEGCINEVS